MILSSFSESSRTCTSGSRPTGTVVAGRGAGRICCVICLIEIS